MKNEHIKKMRVIAFLISILFTIAVGQIWVSRPVFAQVQDDVEVVFTREVSLRSLAEQYLGNPNDWELILYYNGFQHLADLQPDTRLTIPAGLFDQTMKNLTQASETARLANMEGAGVLAKESIDASTRLQTRAMDLKKHGKLEAAQKAALEALQWAEKALSEAQEKKIQTVSALLTHKEGTVQNRRPQQPVWIDAIINQELIEQERVRTLSASGAGILFIDESWIYLHENSLAVIGEMKENVLKRSFKAGVVVLQGDVLAHLSSLGGQKDFSITAPGIETDVRSKKFRTTRNTRQVTRIANYDGEIDVEAGTRKVTIQKDEGTKIEYGKNPETARKLLPPPVTIVPLIHQIFFTPTIRFEWEKLEDARLYTLEISAERDFSTLLKRVQLHRTSYEWQAPHKGLYYYRMYTIDEENFSGPFSDPADLYVDIDESPPYLTVVSPAEGDVVLSRDVVVQGTAEKNTTLTMNTTAVETDERGTFTHLLRLEPGEQIITVTATDPAGNRTSIQRSVICNLEEQLITLDMPNHMTLNMNQVTLKGTIKPLTRIEINAEPVDLPQRFAHIVTLPEGDHTITIEAISPQGNIQTLPVTITVDLTSPEISPDDVPAYTRQPELSLSGQVSEAVTLRVNGGVVPVKEMRFDFPAALKEGENMFELKAVDSAGNTSATQIRILRDTKAPEIIRYSFSSSRVKGGDIISCYVSARDSGVGLTRTGSFTMSIAPGNTVFHGILTLNRRKEIFEGSIFIPPGIQGTVEMKHLQIQDLLGNEAIEQ
ncbi:MAG: hypothetical protein GY801_02070 [bacterium]|nr:hypothetical protein [bacterium]